MYTLLVFDWDGTLMDSEARIVSCMQAAARDLGVAVPSGGATREIIGLGLQEAVDRLFSAEDEATCRALATRYREHFLVLSQSRSQLFPGVTQTLFENGRATLYSTDVPRTMAGLFEWVGAGRLAFRDLVVRQATLEDVFLKLTGRRIRS